MKQKHAVEFWREDPRERDHLEDLGADGRVLNWVFNKWDAEAWAGLLWFRIGTPGGLL
jgi:hypothetical protein